MTMKAVRGTFTTNTSSADAQIQEGGVIFIGGSGGSDFGGGTVTVYLKAVDGAYYASQMTTLTPDVFEVRPPVPTTIRLTLSGATAPDLDYVIQTDSPVIVE